MANFDLIGEHLKNRDYEGFSRDLMNFREDREDAENGEIWEHAVFCLVDNSVDDRRFWDLLFQDRYDCNWVDGYGNTLLYHIIRCQCPAILDIAMEKMPHEIEGMLSCTKDALSSSIADALQNFDEYEEMRSCLKHHGLWNGLKKS